VESFVADNEVGTLDSLCGGPIDCERISALAESNNSNASGPIPMTATDYRRIIEAMQPLTV